MDPNNSRPMSYDSLKILLQYAKPNLRFELSRRIPSIRLTEKAVPLKIDKLWIGSLGVKVNNTFYEARTIRYFPPGVNVSKRFHDSHDGDWDLDEWGFDDFSSETVFTPGDLVLQVQGQNPRQRIQNEENKKDLEKRLKYVEWIIAKKSGENVESEWTGDALDPVFMKGTENSTLMDVKSEQEGIKIRLAPYNCLENNVPLPFTKMVQVAIHSGNGSLCWNHSGNLKYYEVRKQLMTWLFGNRKPVIQVIDLLVTNGIVARLPQNLRISIKTLRTETLRSDRILVDTDTMLNKLEAIINQNNSPLDIFETESIEENFDHPLATNAKKLIVSNRWSDFPNANRLIRIPNQIFYIALLEHFEPEEIIRLIRDWIENPREIGKCFSFEGVEEKVRETMLEIQSLFEGTKTERSIRIPVNNFSQISVSYGDDEAVEWGIKLRLLTIEVVAV